MTLTRRDFVSAGALALAAGTSFVSVPRKKDNPTLSGLMAFLMKAETHNTQRGSADQLVQRMRRRGIDNLFMYASTFDEERGVMISPDEISGGEIATYARDMSMNELLMFSLWPLACLRGSRMYERLVSTVPERKQGMVRTSVEWIIVHPDVYSPWDLRGMHTAGVAFNGGIMIEPTDYPLDDQIAFLAELIVHEATHLTPWTSLLRTETRAYAEGGDVLEHYVRNGASENVRGEMAKVRAIAENGRYFADARFQGVFDGVYPRECVSEAQLRNAGLTGERLRPVYDALGERDAALKDAISDLLRAEELAEKTAADDEKMVFDALERMSKLDTYFAKPIIVDPGVDMPLVIT